MISIRNQLYDEFHKRLGLLTLLVKILQSSIKFEHDRGNYQANTFT